MSTERKKERDRDWYHRHKSEVSAKAKEKRRRERLGLCRYCGERPALNGRFGLCAECREVKGELSYGLSREQAKARRVKAIPTPRLIQNLQGSNLLQGIEQCIDQVYRNN
jgi:hypothetical protein